MFQVEEENSAMVQFQCMQQRRQTPPALPPTPPNLTPQQLKRRHIVAAIVHSENSYVSTLQRLVNVRTYKFEPFYVHMIPSKNFM